MELQIIDKLARTIWIGALWDVNESSKWMKKYNTNAVMLVMLSNSELLFIELIHRWTLLLTLFVQAWFLISDS